VSVNIFINGLGDYRSSRHASQKRLEMNQKSKKLKIIVSNSVTRSMKRRVRVSRMKIRRIHFFVIIQ